MAESDYTDLKAGDFGLIASINGARFSAKRLADLGFVRGAKVTMVRPGAPCIVRIDGRCVGLGAAHQTDPRGPGNVPTLAVWKIAR